MASLTAPLLTCPNCGATEEVRAFDLVPVAYEVTEFRDGLPQGGYGRTAWDAGKFDEYRCLACNYSSTDLEEWKTKHEITVEGDPDYGEETYVATCTCGWESNGGAEARESAAVVAGGRHKAEEAKRYG
jgi:hypothetical protein